MKMMRGIQNMRAVASDIVKCISDPGYVDAHATRMNDRFIVYYYIRIKAI